MKKLMMVLAASALGLAACSDKNSYKVIGTVADAADGDTVFIQEIVGRDLHKTDTAIIVSGKFTFTGRQDSTVTRYLTYMAEDGRNGYATDFFLENGQINAELGKKSRVWGTSNNDIYQSFKDKQNSIDEEQYEIVESLQDTTLTAEQLNDKKAQVEAKDSELAELISQTIDENITNPVGVYLLNRNSYVLDYETLEPLLEKLPTKYQKTDRISHLKEQIKVAKNTAVGQKFIDLEMQDPEGKTVKLSDFIKKNKYTLIDFWASWCPPCRAEMPNLVKVYNEYKKQGFGIVGVSFDKDHAAWEAGIKNLHLTWPQMSDLKFWNSKGAELYAVRSIPYTVLVAQDGTIIAKGLHGQELQEKLQQLLKK